MGVHDHPVDPAHHMEEYRVVLDYFERMDTNHHSRSSLKSVHYDIQSDQGKQVMRKENLGNCHIRKEVYFSFGQNEIQCFDAKTDKLVMKMEIECCQLLCCCNDSLLVVFCKFGQR